VLPGGERVPLDRRLVVGRSRACELRLELPSVSRIHAEIDLTPDGAVLCDMGSSHGTFVDGRRVQDSVQLAAGMRIDLGDCRLDVAERVDEAAAGMTVSVPAGMSVVVPAVSSRRASRRARRAGGSGVSARRPRMHSGWSLKRLESGEGDKRHVLKDHRSGDLLALADPEAALVPMLDGRHDLPELIAEAEARCGQEGLERLARLLAELADHGMLAGIADSRDGVGPHPPGLLERMMTPRTYALDWLPRLIGWVYAHGGYLLVTSPALAVFAAVALVGLVAFALLVAGGGSTPLVVASQVGLGAVVFVLGRLVLVLCHELAHGLCAEAFGRPVTRAGLKIALVFPYVFVDTTDAWFEPRRRRIAISLAGPASDLTLGGAFAIACLACGRGTARDVLFQLAFGGYVGALFNLNPLLQRDGYHVLVDALREPGLRRRASERVNAAIAGTAEPAAPGVRDRLLGYGIASLGWSLVMVAFAVVVSLRYYDRLSRLIPPTLVWTVLAAFYLVLALPLTVTLLRPLWARATRPV
jgi:putative peptide zinc metalloprotease protein